MFIRSMLLLLGLAAAVSGQNVLDIGDVGVVTTAGFYRLRAAPAQLPPTHFVAPASFGLTDLPTPGITWEPRTDSFLVCASNKLVRVTIGPTTTTVTDLSPSLAAGAMLADIDLHPGTGQLVLLDSSNDVALFFAPPFSAGMTPEHTLPLNPTTRSVCFDSYKHPAGVIYGRGGKVERSTLDGVVTVVTELKLANGVDHSAQSKYGTYITKQGTNQILRSTSNPFLAQNMNIIGLCSPVALGPRSIEYDPISTWSYVFAADGLNPICFPGVTGPNHVVIFPPALGAFLPVVVTPILGSGIAGTDGDLALVTADFGFGSPYGPVCTASDGKQAKLLNNGTVPAPGNAGYSVKVANAPSLAPVFVWVGSAPDEIPLLSGCSFLVQPFMSFVAGTTNANGKLIISGAIPAAIPIGTELWLQVCVPDGTAAIYSNGLMLHIGQA